MRIHILGASGSGVTTTGQELAKKLNLQYFDSDNYFWKNTNPSFVDRHNPKERNAKIKSDLEGLENWVLGGSVFQWGDNVFQNFDLVVFLFIQQEIRIDRLKKREFERYGNSIFTDPDRNEQFKNFIAWATDYDNSTGIANRNLKAHENWLQTISFPTLKIIGNFTTDQRIEFIIERIREEKLLSTRGFCSSGTSVLN